MKKLMILITLVVIAQTTYPDSTQTTNLTTKISDDGKTMFATNEETGEVTQFTKNPQTDNWVLVAVQPAHPASVQGGSLPN